MTRYIAIRIGQGVLVVLGAVAISFVLVSLAGDPVSALGGLQITPEVKKQLIHMYGYDRPMLEQFVDYLGSVLQGDFGQSFRQPVGALTLVLRALPATIYLVIGSVLVTLLVSIPVALFSVLRRGSVVDRATRNTLVLLQGVPSFWLAVVLVLVFSVQLRWLPSYGDQGLTSYVLPIAALSIPLLSAVVRLLRSQLLDIMGMEFVTALRAKGLSEGDIVTRHALRNAMPPLVTFMALQIGWLFGGTIIVEAVFGWPGIGSLAITASGNADMTVIQALVVVVAAVYVLLNLLADLLVLAIDPRLRAQR
jgi:ABC-type dipeptide/oligopeptide/nickel transport system permease component